MNNKNNNSNYKTFCNFKYVKNLGNYNFAEKDSPFPIKDSSMTVPDGTAYFCFNENNVEYIVLKSDFGDVFSANAYINFNGKRKLIGYAEFYNSGNKNIYLDRFFVNENYRKEGVGGNILLAMILIEYNVLKEANIYVHSYASSTPIGNQLTQAELDKFYEKYGLKCCDNEEGAFDSEPVEQTIRENLMYSRKIAKKKAFKKYLSIFSLFVSK